MHQTDALLLRVQVGPVDRAGDRGRYGGGHPEADQRPGGPPVAGQ